MDGKARARILYDIHNTMSYEIDVPKCKYIFFVIIYRVDDDTKFEIFLNERKDAKMTVIRWLLRNTLRWWWLQTLHACLVNNSAASVTWITSCRMIFSNCVVVYRWWLFIPPGQILSFPPRQTNRETMSWLLVSNVLTHSVSRKVGIFLDFVIFNNLRTNNGSLCAQILT